MSKVYSMTPDDVSAVNMDCFRPIIGEDPGDNKEFFGECGDQHYKFLAYMSTLFHKTTILDVGTHFGKSALALSYNTSNTVISFDIADRIKPHYKHSRSNIQFELADLWNAEAQATWTPTIMNSAVIFLDVDLHNGTMEFAFWEFLTRIGWRGVLVCDNIWYFKEMRDHFWYKIPDAAKYDMTEYGHWSGTGILAFDPEVSFPKRANSDWTLVTAYFDLTQCPDASAEIRERDQHHYLDEHSISTLHLPYNLVIYCDAPTRDKIYAIRPERLREKTHYVVCDFEEFQLLAGGDKFSQLRDQIAANRTRNPYRFDNRNTPSYMLFCLSRYIMLKRTIESNPFNSTHFGWINICIERMGYKNLIHLDEALACKRDKFSTCHIHYRPQQLVNNYPEYFRNGGLCGMCSGFFTGNHEYMLKFCDFLLQKATDVINAGYGHADEQFFSQVYFDHPDIFDTYYGDYQEMITNYKYSYEKSEQIIHLVTAISYDHGDYDVCLKSCRFVINSFLAKKCSLSQYALERIGFYYVSSLKLGGKYNSL